ncbi:phosphatidate cytidylyltransferase [Amylolactobacillus amylotrophicus DSM 20534]|uniref:Phosphatidate cytidylyltransferase n=3 Tax=Amylolactobacillus TaxID=2767876 RepID=A0A1L6XA87_9LACO|nr:MULTISPECIES: phosphatidate cytidylyltransferase [Amylolactobacillus]APT17872.1 phosphatidate cytidylyltransferase [Amylolactobacillus amylophilus DSM 20533 = JCM 1125]KRK38422.1 phosphatidate cytidylyltransferase [Amylolactobacillus amylotrophicus DSM 20534]KRM42935.1 phosphatidate cytidylyltransferase [Amylolactobacillus amylophilus DSM 20533 = JCM 1125]GED79801.1 phosphatidate cytidylyltransferase [Amylolactobacillus amylophilus]
MRQRVITAVVALIFFIPVLWFGGIAIDIVAAALAVVGISEIFIMRKRIIVSFEFILSTLAALTLAVPNAFFNFLPDALSRTDVFFIFVMLMLVHIVVSKNKFNYDDAGILTLSALYIGTGFHFLAAIRNADNGLALLGYLLVIVWTTDIGAYMIGRKFGKHKLWPVISPNKTWEGSLGGSVAAVILAAIYVSFVNTGYNSLLLIIFAVILSIVGQLGDLVESAYKRHYGVKDSGKILPGHGGILDRFDSLLFVLPVAAFLLLL